MSKIDDFLKERIEEIDKISFKQNEDLLELENTIKEAKSNIRSLYLHRYLFQEQKPEWFIKLQHYFNKLNKNNLKVEDGIILEQLKNTKIPIDQAINIFIQNIKIHIRDILIIFPLAYFLNYYMLTNNHLFLFLTINGILIYRNINNRLLRNAIVNIALLCLIFFYKPIFSQISEYLTINDTKILQEIITRWGNLNLIRKVVYLEGAAVIYCITASITETEYDLITMKFKFLYDWAKNIFVR